MRSALLVCLMVAGCDCSGAEPIELDVRVRTDYLPVTEFDAVRVSVEGPGETQETTRTVVQSDDYASPRGVLVGEYFELAQGDYTLTVRLTLAGALVASRQSSLTPVGYEEVVIAISRACAGDVCDDSGVHEDSAVQDAATDASEDSDADVSDAAMECEECPQDDNPCTVAVCRDGTCAQDMLMLEGSTCSDGVFCNGAEVCHSGVCVAETMPCPGNCDETRDRCQCFPVTVEQDCEEIFDAWTPCSFAMPSDCEGTQTRDTLINPQCIDGGCVYESAPEERACGRAAGDIATCQADDVGVCTGAVGECSGTRPRTQYTCQGTECVGTEADESCPLPVGRACDDGIACTVDDECDDSGGCGGTLLGSLCNDGNVCTQDVCTVSGCTNPWVTDERACGLHRQCCFGICEPAGSGTGGCELQP